MCETGLKPLLYIIAAFQRCGFALLMARRDTKKWSNIWYLAGLSYDKKNKLQANSQRLEIKHLLSLSMLHWVASGGEVPFLRFCRHIYFISFHVIFLKFQGSIHSLNLSSKSDITVAHNDNAKATSRSPLWNSDPCHLRNEVVRCCR